ncbi:hypothetical protein HJ01_00103 [Flavobacterium frigoris PS1]|uniref:Uncharacterized protein n=1 Tax=Flavobacterium frigoris (strain PS1) TaxID=1086011 RepID=H7FLQ5_FLAFP|nr:hypothetical protein HJ01_00103 [Flavobacterium frigoris PS1]
MKIGSMYSFFVIHGISTKSVFELLLILVQNGSNLIILGLSSIAPNA